LIFFPNFRDEEKWNGRTWPPPPHALVELVANVTGVTRTIGESNSSDRLKVYLTFVPPDSAKFKVDSPYETIYYPFSRINEPVS
jgi:hypothetical protein